jgi:arabinose-5-phosphate isomerase
MAEKATYCAKGKTIVNIKQRVKDFLKEERDALSRSIKLVDAEFAKAVRLIREMKGKVIVTGVGKSGLVGQKISATLSSTGTNAVYMHSADAIHGDLGIINAGDVLIAISSSGFTSETLEVVPHARRIGAKIVALVTDKHNQLAAMADCVLATGATTEAGHLKLAPTSSTLTAMAFGDALASVLAELRQFQAEDFALYHPGGQLGRKLLLRVRDLMHAGKESPILKPDAKPAEIIAELTAKRLGGVSIVDNLRSRRLVGIITDGDIRHSLVSPETFFKARAKDLMTPDPVCVREDEMAIRAFELMENRDSQIMVLPVVNDKKQVVGMIRLHDLVSIGFKAERSA